MSSFSGIIEVRYAKWDAPSSLILAYYDTSGQILMRGPLKHEMDGNIYSLAKRSSNRLINRSMELVSLSVHHRNLIHFQ
jgi:hypothetical protein